MINTQWLELPMSKENGMVLKIFEIRMYFCYRENLVQIRVYYETLMTKREEQILEFTFDDLIGKILNLVYRINPSPIYAEWTLLPHIFGQVHSLYK